MVKTGDRLFIQYHNFGKLKYYPGHPSNEKERRTPVLKRLHFVSTKKKLAEKLVPKSDKILLILGIRVCGLMNYFAWSLLTFEKLLIDFSDKKFPYNLQGEQFFFRSPIHLNDLDGFQSFRHRQGNFGLGLQNITNDPWLKSIQSMFDQTSYVTDPSLSWAQWVSQFEKDNGIRAPHHRFVPDVAAAG